MAANFAQTSQILSNPADASLPEVGHNVDSWIESLRPLGAAGQSIIDDLEALKAELTGSSPDGSKIGKLLSSLGQATTQNAGGKPELTTLGQQLSALGG